MDDFFVEGLPAEEYHATGAKAATRAKDGGCVEDQPQRSARNRVREFPEDLVAGQVLRLVLRTQPPSPLP